ncbi:MAG: iron-containing redox enzyme family protein [Patescibacteria group bacterium]
MMRKELTSSEEIPNEMIENDARRAEMAMFLSNWAEEYLLQTQQNRLFENTSSEARGWSDRQKETFVALLYHARGHFYRFLWHLANQASLEQRKVVFENIRDELGGESYAPHEVLFSRFAAEFGTDVQKEMFGRTALWDHFLAGFNDGHLRFILTHESDANWAFFSAYELLDNVDYVNLLNLAKAMGACKPEALEFFEVHIGSTHHEETRRLLSDIWVANPDSVREAFAFIAQHQLRMWRGIESVIMPYAPGVR